MNCPNCNKEVEFIPEESEFCPECGADLRDCVSSSFAAGNSFEAETGSPVQDDSDSFSWKKILDTCKARRFEEQTNAETNSGEKKQSSSWSLSARSKAMAELMDSDDDSSFFKAEQQQEQYFKLEYNHNIFFISGFQSVIKLRITPLRKELSNILIFMVSQRSGDLFRRQIPVTEILQPDKPFYLSIPFNPEKCSGNISISFYIGCQTERAVKYYQFTVEHVVYDSEQNSASLSNQIVINQRFDAQQAADITYKDNLGDAVRELAGKNLTPNELITRLNNLPPAFKEQSVAESTWRPEDILVSGSLYHSDKLALEWNGHSILLLGRENLFLGRQHSSSDLIIHAGGSRLTAQDYPNRTVSRKHAELRYCRDHVKLFDHSSYGTYVNGQLPGENGMILPEQALVEFGDIHWNLTIQQCSRSTRNICQTCEGSRIKSAVFQRNDSEKECYLLVWQCCELGRIFEQLADWDIFFRNDAFFIRTPEQDFFYLRPGHSIESGNNKIQVKYFQQ